MGRALSQSRVGERTLALTDRCCLLVEARVQGQLGRAARRACDTRPNCRRLELTLVHICARNGERRSDRRWLRVRLGSCAREDQASARPGVAAERSMARRSTSTSGTRTFSSPPRTMSTRRATTVAGGSGRRQGFELGAKCAGAYQALSDVACVACFAAGSRPALTRDVTLHWGGSSRLGLGDDAGLVVPAPRLVAR